LIEEIDFRGVVVEHHTLREGERRRGREVVKMVEKRGAIRLC
jgi:hypothetical protein